MKKNIFKGAKFGNKFVTRDGRQAIYITSSNMYPEVGTMHDLVTEDATLITVIDDGFIDYEGHEEQSDDIVSKYHEEIDEVKLNKLAEKNTPQILMEENDTNDFQWGFKVGYKKAKEE